MLVAAGAGLAVILVAVVVAVCVARQCDPRKNRGMPTLSTTNTASNNPVAQRTTGSTRNEFHMIFAGVTPPEATLPVELPALPGPASNQGAGAAAAPRGSYPHSQLPLTATEPKPGRYPKPGVVSYHDGEVTVYASRDYVHRAAADRPLAPRTTAELIPPAVPRPRRSSSPLRMSPRLYHTTDDGPGLRRDGDGPAGAAPQHVDAADSRLAAAPVSIDDCPVNHNVLSPQQIEISTPASLPSSPSPTESPTGLHFPSICSRPGTADSVPDALAFALRDSTEGVGVESGALPAHHVLTGVDLQSPSTVAQDHLETVSHQLGLELGVRTEAETSESSESGGLKTCRF